MKELPAPSPDLLTVPLTLQPSDDEDLEEFAGKCEGGHSHWPFPRYLELHHVVPQSWQATWHPGDDDPPERGRHDGLFDERTVALCRTSHGNVHFWMSRMMRLVKDWGGDPDPQELRTAAIYRQHHDHRTEVAIAALGLERWVAAGGNLPDVVKLGLFGGIYGR